MMEPHWDGVNISPTRKQLEAVLAGEEVRVDVTQDDRNQPLVTPTSVFIQPPKAPVSKAPEPTPG
jgi:hypothetical protein